MSLSKKLYRTVIIASSAMAIALMYGCKDDSPVSPIVVDHSKDSASITVTIAGAPASANSRQVVFTAMSSANPRSVICGPFFGAISSTGTYSNTFKVAKDSLYNYNLIVPSGTMTLVPPKNSLIVSGNNIKVSQDTTVSISTWSIFTDDLGNIAAYTGQ
jgi:hypothetical protein